MTSTFFWKHRIWSSFFYNEWSQMNVFFGSLHQSWHLFIYWTQLQLFHRNVAFTSPRHTIIHMHILTSTNAKKFESMTSFNVYGRQQIIWVEYQTSAQKGITRSGKNWVPATTLTGNLYWNRTCYDLIMQISRVHHPGSIHRLLCATRCCRVLLQVNTSVFTRMDKQSNSYRDNTINKLQQSAILK